MAEEFLSRQVDLNTLATHPENWIWASFTDAYSVPARQVADIQLQALRNRFSEMVEKIQILGNLAEEQGIAGINALEDGAPLLFAHSVYKSYPISFLERNQFDKLTKWLDTLTVDDLSGVDASGIDTIDDWVELLDSKTDIRVIHSSGTSGKLSFIPRSERELPMMLRGWRQNFQGFGDEPHAKPIEGLQNIPVIFNGYRKGALGHFRLLDGFVRYLYDGNEGMVLTRNPGRMSADALSLGGRLSAAAAKGDIGRTTLSPKLLARRDEFIKEQTNAPLRGKQFLDSIIERYRGKRVMMMGNWVYQYGAAKEGTDRGLHHVFARDSLIHTAGGLKGNKLPDNFRDVVQEFLGVDRVHESYGMSEMMALLPKCPEHRHHISPWVIPYLLDPKTGVLFPKTGTQTGRFGFIDLAATTYWGGFLTGDEVTIDWDGTCKCGRIGPRIHDSIRRYTEKEGGDDKITCAGAPEALDKALAFITELA
jgi:hypothetical protein